MKKKNLLALLLAAIMVIGLFAGCGGSASSAASETPVSSAETPAPEAEDATPADETPDEPAEAAPAEEEASISEEEITEAADEGDFTAANAAKDFSGYKEMLKTLTTELPITDEDVTLTYFFGFEASTLNYITGGTMEDHQVWTWLREHTGVNVELDVVNKMQETEQFNLKINSGDYPDLVPAGDYSPSVQAAYEEDIFTDLSDYLEENMPNYWKIINSDQNLLEDVQDGGKFLAIYAVKDQVVNPAGTGTFIRMDWLEDLDLEVPQTYDELTDVLKAFRDEKGASEPMALFNTINNQNGLLQGGFGSIAELSANGMGTSFGSAFYQVDGEVVFGATADGTRKFLSWLNELYNEKLINFENMQNRETNPFSDLNAGKAADGSTGYIFTNQPFGSEYSTMAAETYGDTACNWWPVQDVAEVAGAEIPFYEENGLVDMSSIAITTDCEDLEVALQFLDYGYSYEGSLLYNFGFQKGSGEGQYETWDYNAAGEPEFDGAVLIEVAGAINTASGVIATKDLAGVVFDERLNFSFGDSENACYGAWSTNKTTANILGSDVIVTGDDANEASGIYSDIITYVATRSLQFINGDLDVNGADWDNYVADIESMSIERLTEIIQAAYDEVNP